jgi:hypothetical protein
MVSPDDGDAPSCQAMRPGCRSERPSDPSGYVSRHMRQMDGLPMGASPRIPPQPSHLYLQVLSAVSSFVSDNERADAGQNGPL